MRATAVLKAKAEELAVIQDKLDEKKKQISAIHQPGVSNGAVQSPSGYRPRRKLALRASGLDLAVVGNIPSGWVPPAAVDPLDTDAVTAFYNAGPLIRSRTGIGVGPVTRNGFDPNATPGNPYRQFVLTGLGAGLPSSDSQSTRRTLAEWCHDGQLPQRLIKRHQRHRRSFSVDPRDFRDHDAVFHVGVSRDDFVRWCCHMRLTRATSARLGSAGTVWCARIPVNNRNRDDELF